MYDLIYVNKKTYLNHIFALTVSKCKCTVWNLEGYTLFPKEKEVEQDRKTEEGFKLFTVKTFYIQITQNNEQGAECYPLCKEENILCLLLYVYNVSGKIPRKPIRVAAFREADLMAQVQEWQVNFTVYFYTFLTFTMCVCVLSF